MDNFVSAGPAAISALTPSGGFAAPSTSRLPKKPPAACAAGAGGFSSF